jgi:hypothetical protein
MLHILTYTKYRSHYTGSCKQTCPNGGATRLALKKGEAIA